MCRCMPADTANGRRWNLNWNKSTGKVVTWALRLALGVSFIWASWHKILAPDQFALILYGYGVFPGALINLLAIFVPFVELLAGICLITGLYKRPGLILINAMLACFIIIIGFNLARGHQFDCGCFSFADTKDTASAVGLLVRDILMLGAGLFLRTRFSKESA
ncbi:MAG: DoxX family membrane protein [Desulfobacter sp.]|nr:MAG: DoxX family membrane protein [Desulfobacter sp.]